MVCAVCLSIFFGNITFFFHFVYFCIICQHQDFPGSWNPTLPLPGLLIPWWYKEPCHQQSWCWHSHPRIFQFQQHRGKAIIGSSNGLWPVSELTIILKSIGPLRANFREALIKIQHKSFKISPWKCGLEISAFEALNLVPQLNELPHELWIANFTVTLFFWLKNYDTYLGQFGSNLFAWNLQYVCVGLQEDLWREEKTS